MIKVVALPKSGDILRVNEHFFEFANRKRVPQEGFTPIPIRRSIKDMTRTIVDVIFAKTGICVSERTPNV